ncbi:MAG: ELM1/GtrOC1 family putative glycosyltransferase [Gammaproteobacteria bacterium]
MSSRALVVWQLADGKRGHERQSEGLLTALARRVPVEAYRVAVSPRHGAHIIDFLSARFPAGTALPDPDLLVGAGRACQFALLAARRARGGRTVYLMRPNVPVGCFDTCIVPRHDTPPVHPHIIASEGPLNPLQPAQRRDPRQGLILLGGPSRHHRWDTPAVVAQVERIIGANPDLDWQITDSRRSPPALSAALARLDGPRVSFHSGSAVSDTWLPRVLSTCGQAWVSADSMAMLFEALTAGAAVGLIEVPVRRRDRISAVADQLAERGWVGRIGTPLATAPPVVLAEADRCAGLLLERWPELAAASP